MTHLKKATAVDPNGNIVHFLYVRDLTISEIHPEDEHNVTTVDINNDTDRVEYIGAGVKK